MLSDAAVVALAAGEPFVFFPPVGGFDTNRWKFQKATRVEFAATNAGTSELVWFPRSAVSYITVEEAGVSVALARELHYEPGGIWKMRDAEAGTRNEEAAQPPALPAIVDVEPAPPEIRRPPSSLESLKLVLGVAGGAALALVFALFIARGVLDPMPRTDSAPVTDSRLYTLAREDNYHDIVRKLGPPETERSLSISGGDLLQRALLYSSRDYAVVLLGPQTGGTQPHYIGAIRLSDGAVVASVELARGSSTESLLKMSARQLLRQ